MQVMESKRRWVKGRRGVMGDVEGDKVVVRKWNSRAVSSEKEEFLVNTRTREWS